MASNLAIARGAVTYVPPASLGFWRWTLVFLFLFPFFYKPIKKNFKYLKIKHKHYNKIILLLKK